ncbi:MAG TPA: hypothetical protein P5026_00990 [Kiritimatiellia bacterium]|nr:hypothetical protein [Kiritimatiellia bacterium]HRU69817.1 hypothetical protein [Kiritimatiellia bacterium]
MQRALTQPYNPVKKPWILQNQQSAAGLVDYAGPGLRDHGVCFARRHRDRQRIIHERPLRIQRRRDGDKKARQEAECFHLRKSFFNFHMFNDTFF